MKETLDYQIADPQAFFLALRSVLQQHQKDLRLFCMTPGVVYEDGLKVKDLTTVVRSGGMTSLDDGFYALQMTREPLGPGKNIGIKEMGTYVLLHKNGQVTADVYEDQKWTGSTFNTVYGILITKMQYVGRTNGAP